MSPRFLNACELLQPADLACWEVLLRDAGCVSREEQIHLLQDAMARTLRRLWSLLRATSLEAWLMAHPAQPVLPAAEEGCGLHVLLHFFGTGERALDLIADEIAWVHPEIPPAERALHHEKLRLGFTILAQRELDGLCGDCQHDLACLWNGRRRAARWTSRPTRRRPARSSRRPR